MTKAPWKWRKLGSEYVLWGEHGHRPIVIDAGPVSGRASGKRMLRCNVAGVMRPLDPTHPDMRAIEAVPEALEACKAIMEEVSQVQGWDSRAYALARAALAKAGVEPRDGGTKCEEPAAGAAGV